MQCLRCRQHLVCKNWGLRGLTCLRTPFLSLQEGVPSPTEEPQHQDAGRSPSHCCFSKEELQEILQERNELKTNLFLVQEELAYYQR